jgi:hypothetical protein
MAPRGAFQVETKIEDEARGLLFPSPSSALRLVVRQRHRRETLAKPALTTG